MKKKVNKFLIGKVIFSVSIGLIIVLLSVFAFLTVKNNNKIKNLENKVVDEVKYYDLDVFSVKTFTKEVLDTFLKCNKDYTPMDKLKAIEKILTPDSIYGIYLDRVYEHFKPVYFVDEYNWSDKEVVDFEIVKLDKLVDRYKIDVDVKLNLTPRDNIVKPEEVKGGSCYPMWNTDIKLENEILKMSFSFRYNTNYKPARYQVMQVPYLRTDKDYEIDEVLSKDIEDLERIDYRENITQRSKDNKYYNDMLVIDKLISAYFDGINERKDIQFISNDTGLYDKDYKVVSTQGEGVGMQDLYKTDKGYKVVKSVFHYIKGTNYSSFGSIFVFDIIKNESGMKIDKIIRN